MKPGLFVITELLDSGIAENKDVVWRHALTHDSKKITFWGLIDSMRNIKIIDNQELPFIVGIWSSKENWDFKRKYGTDISVDEACGIVINPLPSKYVRLLLTPENIENLQQALDQISVIPDLNSTPT
uniref:hypothetical protein n=1 Tax=Methylomonas sp. SPW-1 TaxID=3438877 RepID=UPI00402B5128